MNYDYALVFIAFVLPDIICQVLTKIARRKPSAIPALEPWFKPVQLGLSIAPLAFIVLAILLASDFFLRPIGVAFALSFAVHTIANHVKNLMQPSETDRVTPEFVLS